MKIRCEKEELLTGIQIVQKGISTKSTLPVLSCILFCAGENLRLHTTDLETSISCSVDANISKKGSVGVPARLLGDIIRSLPEAKIEINHNESKGQIQLICEHCAFNIKTLPADDFPKVPGGEGEGVVPTIEEYVIKSDSFLKITRQVIRAASKDETRPILTGILLSLQESKVKMVATDSYRLAVAEREVNGKEEKKVTEKKEEENNLRVVIPTKVLEDIIKICSILENEEVKISILENHVSFNLGKAKLTSRLIEGQYPNYQQLIPEEYQVELPVKREELLGAVRRISLMAQNNSPVTFDLGPGSLSISAVTQEVGEAKEDLKVDYKGEELKIAFNGQYLMDGLTAVNQEDVLIRFLDPLKPGVIKSAENDEFLYLLMPVRLA